MIHSMAEQRQGNAPGNNPEHERSGNRTATTLRQPLIAHISTGKSQSIARRYPSTHGTALMSDSTSTVLNVSIA
jgi:hypothetical protein